MVFFSVSPSIKLFWILFLSTNPKADRLYKKTWGLPFLLAVKHVNHVYWGSVHHGMMPTNVNLLGVFKSCWISWGWAQKRILSFVLGHVTYSLECFVQSKSFHITKPSKSSLNLISPGHKNTSSLKHPFRWICTISQPQFRMPTLPKSICTRECIGVSSVEKKTTYRC